LWWEKDNFLLTYLKKGLADLKLDAVLLEEVVTHGNLLFSWKANEGVKWILV
jgi:hypothetical protein